MTMEPMVTKEGLSGAISHDAAVFEARAGETNHLALGGGDDAANR